jgi:hypothetical protein
MDIDSKFDFNWIIDGKTNNLKLLSKFETDMLLSYLYSLNNNINWHDVVKKHLSTNNEKFIKHIKSLTWEDHSYNDKLLDTILTNNNNDYPLHGNSKCRNTFNHISDLVLQLKLTEKNKIYIPIINNLNINFILDYILQIRFEYEILLNTLHLEYEIIETSNINLLTKFIEDNFPVVLDNTKNYNELIYSIFININSDNFVFNS